MMDSSINSIQLTPRRSSSMTSPNSSSSDFNESGGEFLDCDNSPRPKFLKSSIFASPNEKNIPLALRSPPPIAECFFDIDLSDMGECDYNLHTPHRSHERTPSPIQERTRSTSLPPTVTNPQVLPRIRARSGCHRAPGKGWRKHKRPGNDRGKIDDQRVIEREKEVKI